MKVNCRECNPATRLRCINQSGQVPGVKKMILRAFEMERDTEELWRNLQKNCLLLYPNGKDGGSRRPSLLSERLNAKNGSADLDEKETQASLSAATLGHPQPAKEPIYARPVKSRKKKQTAIRHCSLVPQNGRPPIILPIHGKVTLGRFDLKSGMTPDVDLSQYDDEKRTISRNHARVIARHGRHYIEDLGSSNGTMIQEERLILNQKIPLQADDQVTLGKITFTYTTLPKTQALSHDELSRAYLWVAFTGNRLSLPSWGELVVGRSDRKAGIIPDIDLSTEGDVAHVVTRRHIKIIAQPDGHYVEDLGSTNGTKLNGVLMDESQFGPLRSGDHLWLGGCVLVYDLELDDN